MGRVPSSAILRMSWVMRIEQNFGPHIEQNLADLNTSCGSVSSCIARAVSGSSDSSNCRFQSNSKRAFDRASSRSRAPLRPRATVGGGGGVLVAEAAVGDIVVVRRAGVLLGRDEAELRGARLARQRRTDGRRDVIVAGGDVGH